MKGWWLVKHFNTSFITLLKEQQHSSVLFLWTVTDFKQQTQLPKSTVQYRLCSMAIPQLWKHIFLTLLDFHKNSFFSLYWISDPKLHHSQQFLFQKSTTWLTLICKDSNKNGSLTQKPRARWSGNKNTARKSQKKKNQRKKEKQMKKTKDSTGIVH